MIDSDTKWLSSLKVGDRVCRMLSGVIPLNLTVSEVDQSNNGFIHCGPWKFHKVTGGEVDEDIGWDGHTTGSFIQEVEE